MGNLRSAKAVCSSKARIKWSAVSRLRDSTVSRQWIIYPFTFLTISGPLTLQHLLAKSACERVAANACATTCRHHLVPTPAAHAHRPRAHM
eukprot:1160690-Pelagomonas_calceolata.AAC.17